MTMEFMIFASFFVFVMSALCFFVSLCFDFDKLFKIFKYVLFVSAFLLIILIYYVKLKDYIL